MCTNDPHDDLTEIVPKLFLSSIYTAHNPNILHEHSIQRVISVLSDEVGFEHVENVDYFYIEVDDQEKSDLFLKFKSVIQLIRAGFDKGQNVLVHCFNGVSRSTTLVASYLMHSKRIGMTEALNLIRAKRPLAEPNPGFILQLALFEQVKMKFDLTDIWYRRYMFVQLANEVNNQIKASSNVRSLLGGVLMKRECMFYIDELKRAENELKVKRLYKCRGCRTVLFNQNEIVHQSNFTTYTSLLSWMAENDTTYFMPFGRLVCPGCKRKLGRFRWTEPYLNNVSFKIAKTISRESWRNELKMPLVFAFHNNTFDQSPVKRDESDASVSNNVQQTIQ